MRRMVLRVRNGAKIQPRIQEYADELGVNLKIVNGLK
jgi:hypothetical protein